MSVYVLDVYKGTKGATSTSIAPIKVATIMLNILPPAYDAVDKVQGLPGTLLPGKESQGTEAGFRLLSIFKAQENRYRDEGGCRVLGRRFPRPSRLLPL